MLYKSCLFPFRHSSDYGAIGYLTTGTYTDDMFSLCHVGKIFQAGNRYSEYWYWVTGDVQSRYWSLHSAFRMLRTPGTVPAVSYFLIGYGLTAPVNAWVEIGFKLVPST